MIARGIDADIVGADLFSDTTVFLLRFTDPASLAERIADVVSEVSGVPKDRIYIFFDGYPLDSASVNGKLFSKNPPKFGKGAFSAPG